MPVEKRTARTNRLAPVALPRRPFHLRLPDLFADEKPRATPGPERQPPRPAVVNDPTARARSQLTDRQLPVARSNTAQSNNTRSNGVQSAKSRLSQKRFQEGQQHVAGMIERMREKRRKLFDRLWIASIALTALSVLALAVELIQGVQSPVPTRITHPSAKRTAAPRQLVKKASDSPVPPVSAAAARTEANERQDDQPVTSALYTTEEDRPQPPNVWLDGPIANPDSEPQRLSRGGPHDSHQSRTR